MPRFFAQLGLLFALGMGPQGALASPAAPAAAEETPSDGARCDESQDLDKTLLLRRLSLDLRGHLPTYAEYQALAELDEIPEAWIDDWMQGDEFRLAMRSIHEALLWPNPAGVQFMDQNTRLTQNRISDGENTLAVYAIRSPARREAYRGSQNALCGAYLQTEFDENGQPIPRLVTDEAGNPLYQEDGFVWVNPHWAPDETIAVCAFDAQEMAVDTAGNDCATPEGFRAPGCGCGPDLRWCYGPGAEPIIWADLREQFGRAIDEVTVGGASYDTLLTSKKQYMNGRLAFWKKYQAQMVGLNRSYNGQSIGDPQIPDDIQYTDETWQAYTRSDIHSGILTLPAYSLRFQTNRARANRFRIVFTHQYFIPPDVPEDPLVDDCVDFSDDLTQMCTCRSCHQVLEPLAAHFAGVLDAGSTLITDMPEYEGRCDPGNYGDDMEPPRGCRRIYDPREDAHNPGWLQTHQYAYIDDPQHNNQGLDDPLHRAIYDHILAGPESLAQDVIQSGQLATATVQNIWTALMGRDINLDPTDPFNEIDLLDQLAEEFEADYDFQNLVKRLVNLPQYRRIR